MTTKNPKDSISVSKTPFSTLPSPVLAEVGVAMLEGARKYGRHNWRAANASASVLYDAAMRHLTAWWEGEEIDPDSGLPHITKAIAGLMVLRDAQILDRYIDDRPPQHAKGWQETLNDIAADLIERHPDPAKPITWQTEE